MGGPWRWWDALSLLLFLSSAQSLSPSVSVCLCLCLSLSFFLSESVFFCQSISPFPWSLPVSFPPSLGSASPGPHFLSPQAEGSGPCQAIVLNCRFLGGGPAGTGAGWGENSFRDAPFPSFPLHAPHPPHVVMEADMSWAAAAAGGIPAGRFCLEQRHSGSV